MSSFQTGLSPEQIAAFERHGYLVIDDFWSPDVVRSLRTRMSELVRGEDLSNIRSVFSTETDRHTGDNYFLESGRAIRFFWEPKAWDKEANKLLLPSEEAINKVGHGIHDLDPVFEKHSYSSRIGCICKDLSMVKPLLVQSMYIFKHARVGGKVTPHQDGTFLYTNPQSCIGFWWALDDCTEENGCLWAVPGSHKLGVHMRFRRKDPPAKGTEIVQVDPNAPPKAYDYWDLSNAVPLKTKAGTLVILHSALVHYSEENNSEKSRHAYSIHIVDGKEGIEYPVDNWLQRPEGFPFREIKSVQDTTSVT